MKKKILLGMAIFAIVFEKSGLKSMDFYSKNYSIKKSADAYIFLQFFEKMVFT